MKKTYLASKEIRDEPASHMNDDPNCGTLALYDNDPGHGPKRVEEWGGRTLDADDMEGLRRQ